MIYKFTLIQTQIGQGFAKLPTLFCFYVDTIYPICIKTLLDICFQNLINHMFCLDPRIKTLTDAKYKEFRSWFDQRLDDAIAAAEAQEKSPPAVEGKIIPTM